MFFIFIFIIINIIIIIISIVVLVYQPIVVDEWLESEWPMTTIYWFQ